MRSKNPCRVCGKKSSQSGFVFKNILNKCTCKLCYTRLLRSEKEKEKDAAHEMATVEEAAEDTPLVNICIYLMHLYAFIYCCFSC